MNNPPGAPARLAQSLQEYLTVAIITEDLILTITTTHHMLDGTRILDSRLPGHALQSIKTQNTCQYRNTGTPYSRKKTPT